MKTIKIKSWEQTPDNFTGIAEFSNGTKYWYLNGDLHRVDGPACEYYNGEKHWYLNGKRHRVDGPACEYPDGTKYWYLNGKRHRIDGPAIEYAHGSKEYWFFGKQIHDMEAANLIISLIKLKGLQT